MNIKATRNVVSFELAVVHELQTSKSINTTLDIDEVVSKLSYLKCDIIRNKLDSLFQI